MPPVYVAVLCAVGGVVMTPLQCTVVRRFASPTDCRPGVDPRSHDAGAVRFQAVQPAASAIATAAATTSLFVTIGIRFGLDPAVPAYCVLVTALVVLAEIDIRSRRLPREITYPALAIGGLFLAVAALASDEIERIPSAALGAAAALVTLGVIRIASRGELGDGDVRLAPLLGMYLGFVDLRAVAAGLFLGFLLAAIVAVVLVVGWSGRQASIPFGPFLAAGAVCTILLA